ncbi:hypothetical protein [Halobacterium salinarum]|uniref:hypothetical protein n=1 Tax=Halobacterium salinarum TaxID=2242 RepID=UPI002557C4D5|nr:hypothetical protein [Halobacterium salinarum]MDL0133521.1 hypothetical protein [Halobacterium salinarum]
MLTTAEEDRLEAALPTGFAVTHDGGTYDYSLTVHWTGGDDVGADADESPDYPALVLGWNSQNDPQPERQPANNLHEIDNPTDEPGLTQTETEEVSDELSVTVAVRATHDSNGVPPQVRATQLARPVWRALEGEVDLNTEGPDGGRPMRIETSSSPTPARVERTYRYQWAIRLHHRELFVTEVETAADADVSAEQTDN